MPNQSTFVACPIEHLADSRLVMCWLMGDYPPGEMFSVPMSPTGQLPATHYAMHAYMDNQALTDLASGVVPAGYRDLPCDLSYDGQYVVTSELAFSEAQTWEVYSSAGEDVQANYEAFVASSGLKRIY